MSNMAVHIVQEGARQGSRIIQMESTRKYLELIRAIRELSLALFMTQFAIVVAAASFLIGVTALLMLLPISFEWRLGAIAIFHLVTFVVAVFSFLRLHSEEKWMKNTRAKYLVERALRA